MVGEITLSIELELGLGGKHDLGELDHLSEDRSAESETLRRLLDVCEYFEVPVTFDVVGHLLYDSCSGTHSGPYPDSWWFEDPGSNSQSDPQFYAPDLVYEIDDSPVDHEIATHTFSHILADDATDQLLDQELDKVEKAHSQFGLPSPTSGSYIFNPCRTWHRDDSPSD